MLYSYGWEECQADKPKISTIIGHNSLHFIFRGKGIFNGIKLKAGDMFLCKPNNLITYAPDETAPWSYGWLNISDGDEFDQLKKYINFDENLTAHFDTEFPYEKYIKSFFVFEHELRISGRDISYDFGRRHKKALYSAIVALLSADSHRNKSYDAAKANSYIDLAINLINTRYIYSDFTISSLADSIHISTGYLRSLFTKTFGISPQEYLMKVRMEKAKESLTATDYPISIIASSVGYNDSLYFSKMYHKYYGIAPREHRKKNK